MQVQACKSFLFCLHLFLKCWLLLFSLLAILCFAAGWPLQGLMCSPLFKDPYRLHVNLLTQTKATWNNKHVMPNSHPLKNRVNKPECARGSSLCQSIETNQYTQGLYWATSTGARVCVSVCKRLCGQERRGCALWRGLYGRREWEGLQTIGGWVNLRALLCPDDSIDLLKITWRSWYVVSVWAALILIHCLSFGCGYITARASSFVTVTSKTAGGRAVASGEQRGREGSSPPSGLKAKVFKRLRRRPLHDWDRRTLSEGRGH